MVSAQAGSPIGGRLRSATGELVRVGLSDAARAVGLLAELSAVGLELPVAALSSVADPDLALLTLARIAGVPAGREGLAELWPDSRALGRLLAVVGGSAALGDHLVRHPEHLSALGEPELFASPADGPGDDRQQRGDLAEHDAVRSAPEPTAAQESVGRVADEMGAGRPSGIVQPDDTRVGDRPQPVLGGSRADSATAVKPPPVAVPADETPVADRPQPVSRPSVADGAEPTERQLAFRAAMLRAVGADPEAAVPVAESPAPEPLRLAYRRALLRIAAEDLSAQAPTELFPLVGSALADLATGVLEAALAVARSGVKGHEKARLAVIAMGKTGGRELNYVSDVDVVYVGEPAGPDVPEADALAVATQLASALQQVTFGTAKEPPIWQVDPNLRPEGKNGPLVRTLDSHLAYYRKWAKTWEFQALLKARPAAGDSALGEAYYRATREFVWSAVESENFVEDAQAMRRRVERNVPPAEAERQIKLGRGGLRDVEFTVQLLQLVHGRGDGAIRSATTLTALAALRDGGYVGRAGAARLAECYALLRTLEHRVQLCRLKRTHLMPTGARDLRRLARAVRMVPAEGEELERTWLATRREVRSLHEELYYRPLLPATARLSAGEAQLAPDAARSRLAALGYRDPAGAMRHIAALTGGVTRRSAIRRQLLPVMLGWFAEGADPDAGLLSFRRLSEELGSTHWYLRMLRDSAGAAERLSHALAASRFVAEGLARSPESVRWLDSDASLLPRQPDELRRELGSIVERRDSPGDAAMAVRGLRRRELTRLATGMALHLLDDGAARFAVSSTAAVAVEAALALAVRDVAGLDASRADSSGRDVSGLGVSGRDVSGADVSGRDVSGADASRAVNGVLTDVAVIAMGSLGGREMAIGSDADVLFVHRPRPGADESAAQAQAQAIAATVRSLLGRIGPEPPLEVDADLRPEGRAGALARSLGAYREYYDRWALTWERQALLRARPLAGDRGVAEAFMDLADPVRYRPGGLSESELKDLRLLKARIDGERLPRGVEPSRHVKLGPGGLLDVQWVAQLYQLRYAGDHPELRVTGTVEALEAAVAVGVMDAADAQVLIESWMQAMSIRNANVLWTGRVSATSDVVPSDPRHLRGVAWLMGYERGIGGQLVEDRARLARRARAVFDRLFYG
ncbi:MAG: bifunctional [glutamine synthetase] adenylyltransferase/[glutamine synthetase]-adenylyl-L-tyrosine phosphorylase [Bifidobacteriaceae bacterium]|jgi:glutamate-ammonia-ligase adenylyltransferase|nr:bifunctional [glutamine synthetase] adenylyltransferase/[glutamine synthetase]-adenylyl-L-tyrosine phosphorylase [Bifidobacteriaceae bacterium]